MTALALSVKGVTFLSTMRVHSGEQVTRFVQAFLEFGEHLAGVFVQRSVARVAAHGDDGERRRAVVLC